MRIFGASLEGWKHLLKKDIPTISVFDEVVEVEATVNTLAYVEIMIKVLLQYSQYFVIFEGTTPIRIEIFYQSFLVISQNNFLSKAKDSSSFHSAHMNLTNNNTAVATTPHFQGNISESLSSA